jgi:cobalamin biosynthesis protein CobT
MHNGKGYLDRHLQKAIAGIEAEGGIRLGAVGLRHDVSGHYRVNRNASLESLPEDLLAVAMELLSGTSARRPATTEAA